MPTFRVINPTDRHGFVDVLRMHKLERQIIAPHETTAIVADEAKAYSRYVTVETDDENLSRTESGVTLSPTGSTRPSTE